MTYRFIKTSIGLLLFSFIVSGCAAGLALKEEPLSRDISAIAEKKKPLEGELLKGWGNLDMYTDTIPGMSVERAYKELIGKKTGVPVIVGVLDSGTDIHHEDLASVIWTNKKEVAGNNRDDDKNGFVDDVHGWNFLGDAIHDNLEYTRILKILKPKFDGKSPSEIPEDQKEDYALYERAQKKYDEEYEEAKMDGDHYKQLKKNITELVDQLRDFTGKQNLTLDDIEEIDTDDLKIVMASRMIEDVLKGTDSQDTDEILSGLDEAFTYFNDQLEYHLNLDYDGRRLTGDDPDDITDTEYGDADVTGPSTDKEDILHGTHVAGIIGAARENGIGMNGVADNVKLMVIRAVPDGDEYDKDIALGIRYAVDNGAKVINMSFGKYFSPHPQWVIDALKYAAEHDVLLVKAAGNEGLDLDKNRVYPNDQWPGQEKEIVDNMIVVGALNPNFGEDMVAPFSNYGKNSVDVFAPGVKIWATAPLNEYKFLQGTSMAAPGVAGVAAVIRSYFPKLSAAQVKKVIMESGLTSTHKVVLNGEADNLRPFNEISRSGNIVNLYNALIMASKL